MIKTLRFTSLRNVYEHSNWVGMTPTIVVISLIQLPLKAQVLRCAIFYWSYRPRTVILLIDSTMTQTIETRKMLTEKRERKRSVQQPATPLCETCWALYQIFLSFFYVFVRWIWLGPCSWSLRAFLAACYVTLKPQNNNKNIFVHDQRLQYDCAT